MNGEFFRMSRCIRNACIHVLIREKAFILQNAVTIDIEREDTGEQFTQQTVQTQYETSLQTTRANMPEAYASIEEGTVHQFVSHY